MLKIVLGTKNPGKIKRFKGILPALDNLSVLSLIDYPDPPVVPETGTTIEENALLKAKAYSSYTGEMVLVSDDAVYLDFMADEEQPGIYARRLLDRETDMTDQEIYDFWVERLKSVDGAATGYFEQYFLLYKDGEVLASQSGKWKFEMTRDYKDTYQPGYPMSAFCVDSSTGRMWLDLCLDERASTDRQILKQFICDVERVLREGS